MIFSAAISSVGTGASKAILDLLRPSEILHHRQRDGLDRRETQADRENPGE
jgi:hypothetical protein